MPKKKLATRHALTRQTNVEHPELADAFAIKLFQPDLERALSISKRTHIKKSTIVRTAVAYAFEHGFTL